MTKSITILMSLLLMPLPISAQSRSDFYNESYRPQYHFTPEKNWMNDPNGLVYYQGEYHLFYQHNPFGNVWGHMSWGHAVSRDLLHWKHLPVALAEENGVMIFSGSAVVDWNNASGLCKNPDPKDKSCLIAIYTGHIEGKKQSQHLAVSNDRGRTWSKYSGNPVLDIGYRDFRDPKVFWHEATRKWVMVVSLSAEQKVRFYGSKNLLDWELLSDFGPAGVSGKNVLWECPDLFELPVDGQRGNKRWVLIVNINPGGVAGGSGGQYFIGKFDGQKFTNDNPPETKLFVDYGKDFYAGVTFSDIPNRDGRRILLGWMSNWQYAQKEPTSPWRTAQSLPRVLTLKKFSEGVRLIQHPINESKSLRDQKPIFSTRSNNSQILRKPPSISGDALEIISECEVGSRSAMLMRLRAGTAHETMIGYDAAKKEIYIDRSKSGAVDFDKNFSGRHSAPVLLKQDTIKLQVFVDRSSLEVFINDGEAVITDRVFPSSIVQSLELETEDSGVKYQNLAIWKLHSVWHK